MGRANATTPTSPGFMRLDLCDPDIVRASEFQHPVQGGSSDGDFGGLGLVSTRSKGIADHAFVSTNCGLDLGPKIVATRLLPAHAAIFGDFCRDGPNSGHAAKEKPATAAVTGPERVPLKSHTRQVFRTFWPLEPLVLEACNLRRWSGLNLDRPLQVSSCLRGSSLRRSSPGRQPRPIRATTSCTWSHVLS